MEARITRVNKRFLVKMDLIPQDSKLILTSLQFEILDTEEVPLESVVPVTPIECKVAHIRGKLCTPPDYMDFDTVYLNKPIISSIKKEFGSRKH